MEVFPRQRFSHLDRARQRHDGCWNVQRGQSSDSISSQMVSSRPWNRVQVHAGTVRSQKPLVPSFQQVATPVCVCVCTHMPEAVRKTLE